MKHILILFLIFGVTSCYTVIEPDYPKSHYGMFNDICTVGDTATCHMSCNINHQEVIMSFFKQIRRTLSVKEFHNLDKIYYIKNDTLILSYEEYRYAQDEFASILKEKNTQQRDTSIIYYTKEMFFSWEVFDKIYNLYYE